MNLFPYLNLCKAEKIKSKINSKDITERFLFSLFDSSIMAQIGERVYSKVIIFLIASDWCSPIIVTIAFLDLILKN